MFRIVCAVILVLAFAAGADSQIAPPPVHVASDLTPGGVIQLNWNSGPANGLDEDFEDGIAQDFHWLNPTSDAEPQYSYYLIENGYTEMYSDNEHNFWSSGASGLIGFTDFTLNSEIRRMTLGVSSRGIIFRCDGPKNNNFNGYAFLIGIRGDTGSYSFGQWVNGWPGSIIYWTESDAINTDIGETNVLKVVAYGQTFDFYINDIYVATDTDLDFSSGYVGIIQANGVTAQYDYITCTYEAQLQDRSVQPRRGAVVTEWLDEAGRPTDHPPVMAPEVERRQDRSELLQYVQNDTQHDRIRLTNELDDFVEYRIYRNGVFIGATPDTVFTDQLPNYGTYEYRVTAVYDPEGESIPSVAEIVNWNAVTYALEPVNYVVPYTGGTITYDALLFSELNQSFQNVIYRTFVTMPDQTVIGPTFQRSFTLGPHACIHIPEIPVQVPANAPPGNYFLTGRLFYQGAPLLEQTFQFDKMGGGD